MPIKAKTTYTRENLLRFQIFVALSKRTFWAFMIMCSAFLMAITITALVQDGFILKAFLYLMLVILIDLACIFTNFIMPFISVKKVRSLGSEVEYSFDENEIGISVKSKNASESGAIKYAYIHKVARDKGVVYAFISKRQAYIVDISALDQGQKEQLKSLFLTHLGTKRVSWK